ncbi:MULTISPECIES: CBS domain-containing protein [Paracoccaceae]|jgi:CBS domain-containing protein|uniref:CBS domain-containing protein n=1 Tax=Rhodobacterales TaxID=204455 RepID=UPI001B05E694|nr:CBS domain-containing protein [Boseongicola sp. H5]MBO6604089.1 CBS domain-containing protein [Roseicyclus sp.]MBO6624925.1 CBS domain-containing protein [Roseicyclus sp.]MBO6921247.1 CBS domain-containing protein [Roseicyclus sp.]
MLVQQILKSKPTQGVDTIKPGSTVAQVAEALSKKRIGALVVSADGKAVAGIVSERDIVRELGARGPSCMAETVDSLMTKDIISCTGEETSDAVLAKMTQGRFRHMPVMDGADMVGLISIGDVVKAQLSKLAMEKEALESMIKGF